MLYWLLPLWRGGHCRDRGFNKSQCMDCEPGQKQVAIVEGWLFWRDVQL